MNVISPQYFILRIMSTLQGEDVAPGPDPPNLLSEQFSLLSDVNFETTPPGTWFGDVMEDADDQYTLACIS